MISEKVYCGLDIGAQKIKAAILKVHDAGQTQLMAVAENKTQGLKDLSVRDLGELSECIHTTISQAAQEANIKIKEVQLGIGGEFVELRETSALIPLVDRGNKIITQQDIKKVNHQANLLGLKMDEQTLHSIAQYYLVDDVNTALNPVGLYGRKLGVEALLIVTNINRVRNITHAVNHAGYDVGHLYFGTYAASEVVFSKEQKQKGCVLLDVGAAVTSILIFKEGVLKYLSKIDIGGDHFTRRIVEKLNLSFDLAEELKQSYAVALSTDQHQKEDILLKQESNYVPVKREVLYQAIEGEILNFIQGIELALKTSGFRDQINDGITMIGAGALLTGFIERIEGDLHLAVKLGKVNISSRKTLNQTGNFASCIGLAQHAYKQSSCSLLSSEDLLNWRKSLSGKIKELYEEYF